MTIEAIGQAFEEYRHSLVVAGLRRGHDITLVEDSVQDVFLRVVARKDRLETVNFPYLQKTFFRVLIDRYRHTHMKYAGTGTAGRGKFEKRPAPASLDLLRDNPDNPFEPRNDYNLERTVIDRLLLADLAAVEPFHVQDILYGDDPEEKARINHRQRRMRARQRMRKVRDDHEDR